MEHDTVNDRLSSKILELLKSEITKTETQKKIKCMIDPLSIYLVSGLQPYVFTLIILMIFILLFQGYITLKLWYVTHRILT